MRKLIQLIAGCTFCLTFASSYMNQDANAPLESAAVPEAVPTPRQPASVEPEAPAEAFPMVSETIYLNGHLNPDWQYGGSSSKVDSTESGIQVSIQAAWGALSLDHRTEDYELTYTHPEDFRVLSFDINPGSTVGPGLSKLQISLGNSSINQPISKYAKLEADTWTHVTIPLEDLNSLKKPYFQVIFFNASGVVPVDFKVNQVTLGDVEDDQR